MKKLITTLIVAFLSLSAASQIADSYDNIDISRLSSQKNEKWVEFLLGIIPTTSVMIVTGTGTHIPSYNTK